MIAPERRRLGRFAGIGVASTVAYAVLYVVLRGPLGAAAANALALAVTAVGNTAANRRLTFGVHGRAGLARQHGLGALVYAIALAVTSGALAVLHALDRSPSRALEVGVLVVASAGATVARYVALKTWVFRAQAAEPSSALTVAMIAPPSVTAASDRTKLVAKKR